MGKVIEPQSGVEQTFMEPEVCRVPCWSWKGCQEPAEAWVTAMHERRLKSGLPAGCLAGTHTTCKAQIRLHGRGLPQSHVSWQRGEEKPCSKAEAPRERINWAGWLVRGHLQKGYLALLVTRPLNRKPDSTPRWAPLSH